MKGNQFTGTFAAAQTGGTGSSKCLTNQFCRRFEMLEKSLNGCVVNSFQGPSVATVFNHRSIMRKLISICALSLLITVTAGGQEEELLDKIDPPVEWAPTDYQGYVFKSKIYLHLFWRELGNGLRKYRLQIYFPPVYEGVHPDRGTRKYNAPSIVLAANKSSSISLSIDDKKAQFKTQDASENSLTELYYQMYFADNPSQSFKSFKFVNPNPPNPAWMALVNLSLGQIEILGDLLDVMDVFAGFDSSSKPSYGIAFQSWIKQPLTSYDMDNQPDNISEIGNPESVFTDDGTYDIMNFTWNNLTDKTGWAHTLDLHFEILQEVADPVTLYIRAALPYYWARDRAEIDTSSLLNFVKGLYAGHAPLRYAEVEWKVQLPQTQTTMPEESDTSTEVQVLCPPTAPYAKIYETDDEAGSDYYPQISIPADFDELEVAWMDRSSNEDGFKVRHYKRSGFLWEPETIGTTLADETKLKVTGIAFEAGESYSFDVCAYNDTSEGDGVCSVISTVNVGSEETSSDCPACPECSECAACPPCDEELSIELVTAKSELTGTEICRDGFSQPQCRAYQFINPNNLASLKMGATSAVARNTIRGWQEIHQPIFVNDEYYGNASSWIGAGAGSWIKIDLGQSRRFNRIRFGRDRTGGYDDRDPGRFVISVADQDTYANGDETNDEQEYRQIVNSSNVGFEGRITGDQTVLVKFPPVTARYVKLMVANNGAAIDEVEISYESR